MCKLSSARGAVVLAAVVALAIAGSAGLSLADRRVRSWVDPAFGDNGTTRIDVPGLTATAADLDIAPDGRITVLANGHDPSTGQVTDVVLAGLTEDGTLDGGFGDGGVARIPNPSEACHPGWPFFTALCTDTAQALERQGERGWIVAGTVVPATEEFTGNSGLILRSDPSGTLDSTFGGSGLVVETSGADDHYSDVALDDQGRIVAAGYQFGDPATGAMLHRYSSDGTPDATFHAESGDYDGIAAVEVLPGGKIVAAGWSLREAEIDGTTVMWTNPAVVQFLSDGSLDPTFGSDGVMVFDLSAPSTDNVTGGSFSSLAVGPGGVVVAGATENAMVAVRITPAGLLDRTFGDRGVATFGDGTPGVFGPFSPVHGVAILPDGDVVVASTTAPSTSSSLYRLGSRGKLDRTFAEHGRLDVAFDVRAIRPEATGRIVLAGDREGSLFVTSVLANKLRNAAPH